MGAMITGAGPGVGLAEQLHGRLVGRARERRLLDGLVESVEGGGAAVVIAGEAGVGKTALLMHVADVASDRGLRVLQGARGGIRGCPGVCHPRGLAAAVRGRISLSCRRPSVRPWRCAWPFPTGPRLARWRRARARWGCWRAGADEQPLVVLVDDFQWVDPESRQILLFAARRLAAERIVMLFAVRDEPGAQHSGRGLPISADRRLVGSRVRRARPGRWMPISAGRRCGPWSS